MKHMELIKANCQVKTVTLHPDLMLPLGSKRDLRHPPPARPSSATHHTVIGQVQQPAYDLPPIFSRA